MLLAVLFFLPACSLVRAPIIERDGGDPALDAPVDVGEALDGGRDAGLDAATDGSVDTGVDSGMPDSGVDAGVPDTGVDVGPLDAGPPTCTTRYGAIPGFDDCGGVAAGLCRFYVDPTDGTTSCSSLCGAGCLGVYEDGGRMCGGIGGAIAGGCPRAFDHMVCFCTL